MIFRRNPLVLLVALGFTVLVGCASAPLKHMHGNEYYTQVGLWAEEGQHITTNYRTGRFIPANTPVKLIDSTPNSLKFRVPSMGDYTITVVNKQSYSGEGIAGIFQQLLGPEKVDLDKFSDDVYDAIRSGEIRPGMSKQAVLFARGYPPGHETPTLDSDTWKYWNSRFESVLVRFENGKVSEIKK